MKIEETIPEMFENAMSYPQLDTILMVERFIQSNSAMYRRKTIWQRLPKKMRYQTFQLILDYLMYSNKVAIDSEKKVVWVGITSGKLLRNSVPAK